MIGYILKKLLYGLLVMGGVVLVVFVLFNILPGDPARMTMGQRADVQSLEAVRKEFGLDKSKPVQFLLYINDLSPISVLDNDSTTKAKYNFVKLLSFDTKVLALNGHTCVVLIKLKEMLLPFYQKQFRIPLF